jgi:hypothetical protein
MWTMELERQWSLEKTESLRISAASLGGHFPRHFHLRINTEFCEIKQTR